MNLLMNLKKPPFASELSSAIDCAERMQSGPPGTPRSANLSGGLQESTESMEAIKEPSLFKVMLLNDDFTPMDFVILVLKRFFGKTDEQATKIMLDVHKKGAGLAGVYTLELAEMKVMQVSQLARSQQHPLKCTLEEE